MILLLYTPLVIGMQSLFWGLPSLQFYPWREFAFEQLKQGQIAVWNPYNGAGAPLFANYQTALLYPPNWLHLILPHAHAMSLIAVLHIVWAGAGMTVFTRRLGVSELGQGISSLSFAFAGYGIARLGSLPTFDAYAWLPWLFWAVLAVTETRRAVYIGQLGLVTGLLLLAGHAQTAFYSLLAAGLFALWVVRVWLNDQSNARRLASLLLAGLGVLLGVGIAAAQLMFTGELLAESQRSGGVDYDTLTNLSFAPLRVINFLTPNFFGSPVDGSYLTPDSGVYFEDAVYFGLLPLIASLAAIWGWWSQWRSLFAQSRWALRSVPFWTGLALLGLILATGRYGPVYHWLYETIPTFDAFREPVRWLIWPVFALCVLAGIGVAAWGRGGRLFFWTRLAGAGGAAMFLLAFLARQTTPNEDAYLPVLTAALMALGGWLAGACLLTLLQPDPSEGVRHRRWQWAVLLFIAADLTWAAEGLNPTVPPRFYGDISLSEPHGRLYWFEGYEEQVKFEQYFDLSDYRLAGADWPALRRSLLPNLNMVDRLAIFNNFDPLKPRYHTRYVELLEARGPTTAQLLQAAGVGQVYGDYQPQGWEAIQGEYTSHRTPQAIASAWVVPQAQWADDEALLESYLLDPLWQPQQTVILRGVAPTPSSDTPAPSLTETSFFEVLEDRPTLKRYRVVTNGAGYLVIANTWYPGWSAEVDDKEQPLYRANLSFMAIPLPNGGGEVTLRYLPEVNLISVAVSIGAFFGALALIVVGLIRQNTTTSLPPALR
jgi:hypothetical protein